MALFFDLEWFDARLRAHGLTRQALAKAADMSMEEVDQVFGDNRELSEPELAAFARVLGADPTEIATRSGAADYRAYVRTGPVAARLDVERSGHSGDFTISRDALAGLHERMDRLERLIEMLATRIDRLR